MIRKLLPLCLVIALIGVFTFACEEPDPETVARIIKSASTVAFGKIIDNNPELTDTLMVYAILSRQIIVERTIDPDMARSLIYDILEQCRGLEEEDQELVLTLFNTVLPLIELPEEGLIEEPQRTYLIAMYEGIIMACENKKALEGPPEPPPVSWEVWLRDNTIAYMRQTY